MANFNSLMLTEKGKDLRAKAEIGATINYTRVVLGDGALPDGQNIELMESVISEKLTCPIAGLEAPGNGTSVVSFLLTNLQLNEGFYVREIGLMADDPDIGEILYCYTNSRDESDFLPAKGGPTVVESLLRLVAVVGNAATVTANIGPVIIATKEDISAHDADPGAHGGIGTVVADVEKLIAHLAWANS